MLKKILLGLILLPTLAAAQDKTPEQKAVESAQDMCTALQNKEYYGYVKYVHPEVINMTHGNTTQFVANVQKQYSILEDAGSKITDIHAGNPSTIIDTAGELQCVIPQVMQMKIKGGTIETLTRIIGVSKDKGETWHFIDANGKDITNVRYVFPTISSRHPLPPNPQPKFVADKP